MTTNEITIAPFLTAFVEAYRADKPAAEVKRITYLDALLRRCVEATSDRGLCDECRVLLDFERAFNPVDPFASAMGMEKLIYILGVFVHSPWLRSDVAMEAAQWRFVRELVRILEVTPIVVSLGYRDEIEWLREHIDRGLRSTSQRRSSRRR
ncbi:hypothetical protein ABIE21_001249 [Conyzicola nivalis]|uniref:Uncharacterized protein n=1 Tax=Conyzicola nivalis TaxID=1477021 RepID=A0ABV2QL32_9MICO